MVAIPPIKTASETLIKKGMNNGKEVSMKFAKDNGRLNAELITKVEGYELGPRYSYKADSDKKALISKIQKICEQTKDGAKLFAEIMGWIK